MWSVSGIFLNAQKVITTPHSSVLSGIKSGNIRRSIFKTTSSKNLQKYRNPTHSESAKTRYYNKKQLVLMAEKCLQQLYMSIWRNSMQRLIKRVLNSLHKTRFWITTLLTDVKQFFQKNGYYNYYPVEFEEFLQTPTFLLHFEIKLQRFRSNCFGQCCILLNISPCADISMLKHHEANFSVQIWMQILIRHTLASELISFLFMSTLKAVLVDTIVPHSSKWELNIERAITTPDCSCRRH